MLRIPYEFTIDIGPSAAFDLEEEEDTLRIVQR